MKVVKKIFRWIFDIILFIILAIALIMAYNHIQINIKGNTYTTMLGYSAFEVATGSMSNTIEIDRLKKDLEKYQINQEEFKITEFEKYVVIENK